MKKIILTLFVASLTISNADAQILGKLKDAIGGKGKTEKTGSKGGKWEVAKDKYTGAILYKHATYYAVGERRPEKVNGVTTKYFILPTHAKCDYLGNGQYGEPSYVKVITGSTDITEEEFKNYKMSAVE
jgi:hypothetical protein